MKEKITEEQVEYISKLAKVPLQKSEFRKFTQQLSEVIDFNINLLKKVETENVNPTGHIEGQKKVSREDKTEPGLTVDEALQNSKSNHNGFFKVKSILDRKDESGNSL